MDSPSRTLACTSTTALDITLLLTVSATMSSACRMGTPERSSIPAVLEKRDSAVLWNSVPKIGIFSLIASRFARPFSVFL